MPRCVGAGTPHAPEGMQIEPHFEARFGYVSIMARIPQTILITGASSGIGRALAVTYSEPGKTLILMGRDAARLEEVARDCRSRGANVEIGAIDVRDRQQMHQFITRMDEKHRVELLIANAGVSTGLSQGAVIESPEATRAIFEINVYGVINAVQPIVPRMCDRKNGQIALVGSMAALRGLPYTPAYCATKSAVHLYAESLRGLLRQRGVLMSLVVPGFVHTPFNSRLSSPKPFAVSAERAATVIQRGLQQDRAEIIFPRLLYFVIRFVSLLPSWLIDAIMVRVAVDVPETRERERF